MINLIQEEDLSEVIDHYKKEIIDQIYAKYDFNFLRVQIPFYIIAEFFENISEKTWKYLYWQQFSALHVLNWNQIIIIDSQTVPMKEICLTFSEKKPRVIANNCEEKLTIKSVFFIKNINAFVTVTYINTLVLLVVWYINPLVISIWWMHYLGLLIFIGKRYTLEVKDAVSG